MRAHHTLIGLWFLLAVTPAFGGNRLDLPQVSAEVTFKPGELQSVFDLQGGENGRLLPARETQF